MTHLYHNHCDHRGKMSHCTHCDQAYCTSCGKNWYYSSWNQPVYYCGSNQALCGTSGTLTTGTGITTEVTNAKHDH